MSLLTRSATELAALIRNGEVSSLEVVDAHVTHARRVNPVLNAVVVEQYEQALAAARRADQTLHDKGAGNVGPLHGVPCTIKESFAVRGLPQTSGLVSRRNAIASEDAVTVRRLRDAGAIVLGVTNVSELCMWMETNNRVYGRTNNPYDPTRIVGGSSGGEGAIIGAGASPFGLGADVGGSIRMPAFFNGVFGHKASSGLVPNTGQHPNAHGEALRYLSTGPIARRAEDLHPLLTILKGPDGADEVCVDRVLPAPEVDFTRLRVLDVPDNGSIAVSPELRAAQAKVVAHLASLGAKIETPKLPALSRSFDIWSAMLSSAGGPSFAEMMADGRRFSALGSLAAWTLRRSDHTLPAIALALLEGLGKLAPARTRALVEAGRKLKQELHELLGDDSVMLYPSFSCPSPLHDKPLTMGFHWVYTAILNVMELPVTQAPLGLSPTGPLGVQIAAAHGRDHATLAVALELEKAFGGWVPPPRWFSEANVGYAASA